MNPKRKDRKQLLLKKPLLELGFIGACLDLLGSPLPRSKTAITRPTGGADFGHVENAEAIVVVLRYHAPLDDDENDIIHRHATCLIICRYCAPCHSCRRHFPSALAPRWFSSRCWNWLLQVFASGPSVSHEVMLLACERCIHSQKKHVRYVHSQTKEACCFLIAYPL